MSSWSPDCHLFVTDFAEAISYYENSLAKEENDLTKVFLSRAVINIHEINKGRELLSAIDVKKFNEANKYDFAISWALLAFSSKDKNDIDTAKIYLKQDKSSDPLFLRQRDKFLIDLLELDPKEEKGKFSKALNKLNRYVTLNPNFFGFGINLNNIIEDVESRKK